MKSAANVHLGTKRDSHAAHRHAALFHTEPRALHWEAGGFVWSVCERELKRSPVNQQPCVWFASLWLIKGSLFHSFTLLFLSNTLQKWEISWSVHESTTARIIVSAFPLTREPSFSANETVAHFVTFHCASGCKWMSKQVEEGCYYPPKELIRAQSLSVFVKGLKVTTEWSRSSQLYANCIIHTLRPLQRQQAVNNPLRSGGGRTAEKLCLLCLFLSCFYCVLFEFVSIVIRYFNVAGNTEASLLLLVSVMVQ